MRSPTQLKNLADELLQPLPLFYPCRWSVTVIFMTTNMVGVDIFISWHLRLNFEIKTFKAMCE